MEKLSTLNDIRIRSRSHPLCLLLIKTQTCGVCEAVEIKISEQLLAHPQTAGVYAYLEEVPEMAAEYLAFTAPTVILLYKGKEIYRTSRFVRFAELNQTLSRYERELEF